MSGTWRVRGLEREIYEKHEYGMYRAMVVGLKHMSRREDHFSNRSVCHALFSV